MNREATLKVFCAGAVKSAVTDLARAFERDAGQAMQFTFGTVGGLEAKVVAGEPVDILILARPALDRLATQGRVRGHTIVDLGRVGVGVAVRGDAPLPDVSTPDALREALLAAKSLAYGDPAKGDSSGIHFAKVLERLNIAQAVKAKTVLAPVGLAVAELVENGEAALGATQASVILARRGIRLAGLLPAVLQHLTTYSAAVAADRNAAAQRFVDSLTTPAARSKLEEAGFAQS